MTGEDKNMLCSAGYGNQNLGFPLFTEQGVRIWLKAQYLFVCVVKGENSSDTNENMNQFVKI